LITEKTNIKIYLKILSIYKSKYKIFKMLFDKTFFIINILYLFLFYFYLYLIGFGSILLYKDILLLLLNKFEIKNGKKFLNIILNSIAQRKRRKRW